MSEKVLEVKDLVVQYGSGRKAFVAVHGVNIEIEAGETLGLVGESGSGKTTIGKAILGLEATKSGSIKFMGRDVTRDSLKKRKNTAAELRVVFQDPYSSLNPEITIGETLIEPLLLKGVKRADALQRARVALSKVGLPDDAADRLPRGFSGGQRQRIAVARALVVDPKVIVLDEPVSALDLSTQAQVLNLLADLAEKEEVGFLFIAHDLDVVRFLSQRVVVLYRGRVMEVGPVDDVVENPKHPYTKGLTAAAPVPNPREQAARRAAWQALQNVNAGKFADNGIGCPYAPRCPLATQICGEKVPELRQIGASQVACHNA